MNGSARAAGRGAILACLLFETACVEYKPHPLNPVQSETEFRSRIFNSPGLADFARAESGDPAMPWPPEKFGARSLSYAALFFSPAIQVARAEAAERTAAVATARQRVNPSISAEGGRNKTPESVSTYAFTAAFTIETAGKRGYRVLEAEKLAQASGIALWESAWEVRSRLRAALSARRMADLRVVSFRDELALRDEIVSMVEKRVALGEAATPELLAVRADRAAVNVSLRNAEGEAARATAAIAQAVAVPVAALQAVTLDLTPLDALAPPDALPLQQTQRAGLLHRADIRRLLVEYEAADARLRLEIANQYPNVVLNPAYTFQEGFPSYTLGSMIESLPVFHRNQGPIAEREAARRTVESRFLALQARVVSETETALRRYAGSYAELAAAREAGEKALAPRERAAAASFRAGETDRLELTQTRLARFAADRASLDALERAFTALAELEDAIQAPLDSAFPAPRQEKAK